MSEICNSIALNSLRQYHTLKPLFPAGQDLGLCINPQHQIAENEQYDPCCDNSRLGVRLTEIAVRLHRDGDLLKNFNGIHFHTNCEGDDFRDLEDTVDIVIEVLGDHLRDVKWINLGGGYYFNNPKYPEAFERSIEKLKSSYQLETYFEPGGGIVNSAGYLVSTVLDIVGPAHEMTAVLDTSVNHLPESLEFHYEPDVFGDTEEGFWKYTLAGASCLAGDVFGDYAFAEPLKIGEQVVMENVGAYSHAKCHSFNGINIPTIYIVDQEKDISELVSFEYRDFARKNGLEYIA